MSKVIVTAAYPCYAEQFLDEGHEVFNYPDNPWPRNANIIDLSDEQERQFSREIKRWKDRNPEGSIIDVWSDFPAIADDFNFDRLTGYFGAGTAAWKLEDSRRFARTLLRDVGVTAGHDSFSLCTKAEKIAWLREAKNIPGSPLFVVKADHEFEGNDYFNVIVPETYEEMEWAVWQFGADKAISLEQRVMGIEVAFTAVYINGVFTIPLHTNFEFKKALTGGLGVNAGEVGTLMVRGIADPVIARLFAPLAEYMRSTNYTGYCDLNCIYTPETKSLTVLEFTMRFGNPTHQVYSSMVKNPATTMIDWANRIPTEPVWTANTGIGIVLVPGGFPFSFACKQHMPATVPERFVNGSKFHRMCLRTHPDYGYIVRAGRQGVLVAARDTVKDSRVALYEDVKQIDFEDIQYRLDVGEQWDDWKRELLSGNIISAEQAEY